MREKDVTNVYTKVLVEIAFDDGDVETVMIQRNAYDLTAENLVCMMRQIMGGLGYAESSIKEAFNENLCDDCHLRDGNLPEQKDCVDEDAQHPGPLEGDWRDGDWTPHRPLSEHTCEGRALWAKK